VTRCQGVSLHSPGCAVSVPLVCRSLGASSKREREDLSDQELPIIGAARNASEALPCKGNALSPAKLISADLDLFFGGSDCPLLPQ
jgi:hypothetical protein